MKKRKGISKKTRFEVFKRDSFTCQYCGASAPDVVLRLDHIQPVSKDGEDDILNLITSCFECNAGKSDRLLSDNSVITKQKAQLDELNERREQLEMMIQWREGLSTLKDLEFEAACGEWERVTESYYLNDSGIAGVKKLIRSFGLNVVLDAMQKAARYLEPGEGNQYTKESVEHAFSKVGGICRLSTLPEWHQQIYFIRNIARGRAGGWWQNSTSAEILHLLEKAYKAGYDLDDLKNLALDGHSFTKLYEILTDWISNAE